MRGNPTPKVELLSTNDLDRTMTLQINGVTYEYWFHGEVPLETFRNIHKRSPGRALAYVKKVAYKFDKLGGLGDNVKNAVELQTGKKFGTNEPRE